MKFRLKTAHWRVPSEERAFEGWFEGSPSEHERVIKSAEIVRARKLWTPNDGAWGQLRELERFIGNRISIQFWDPIMNLLCDEGPYPMLANCSGLALFHDDGFCQAYLILDSIQECPDASGYSPAIFLNQTRAHGLTLAPIAELLEVEVEHDVK